MRNIHHQNAHSKPHSHADGDYPIQYPQHLIYPDCTNEYAHFYSNMDKDPHLYNDLDGNKTANTDTQPNGDHDDYSDNSPDIYTRN